MLKLINICKDYVSKDQPVVHALKNININFRRSEFVGILGHSGCGKTTLLNIIGGLDRYTDGDLIIEGKSTKDFTTRDWDTYRNHSIGFVFQSYNLISHINILKNVELALTISGVNKKERILRAKEALKKVGLEGLEKKMPNQLSGGQMQRVAIARALVNNPEILLADEPTGALDSETSLQIMDLLKEVSKDRLVIMVTHNPELATQYASRIIKIKDGEITSDTMPYEGEKENEHLLIEKNKNEKSKGNKKQSSMSFLTSFGLSLTNLLSKKGRTILTAFAGSIGIIGIALVLSLSFGFNSYINSVQKDALTSYPLAVNKNSFDVTSLISNMMSSSSNEGKEKFPSGNEISEGNYMSSKITQLASSTGQNNVVDFKKFMDDKNNYLEYADDILGVQYRYNMDLNIYSSTSYESIYPVNLKKESYYNGMSSLQKKYALEYADFIGQYFSSDSFPAFSELIPNYDYNQYPNQNYNSILDSQFDCLYGKMPKEKNEIVVIVDQYNSIDDYLLISMGLKSPRYLIESLLHIMKPNIFKEPQKEEPFKMTFEEMCQLSYYLPTSYMTYKRVDETDEEENLTYFKAKSGEELKNVLLDEENTLKLNVVGIVRPKKGVTSTSLTGSIGYLPSLTDYLIDKNSSVTTGYIDESTNVVLYQKAHSDINAFTGKLFIEDNSSSYKSNLKKLGICDKEEPTSIYIYPRSFSSKNRIKKMIDEYNVKVEKEIRENNPSLSETELKKLISVNTVMPTDTVGTLMGSVQTIVDSVSIVLIAFVSISLLVSSIMIGIITYVSVIERTKEIGVLRAMGARKIDIANVFNAETFLEGLSSGLIGIIFALILDIPISLIISSLAEISLTVIVPWYGIIILPVISFVLTLISGLIPASIASKKDPVIALRSE